MSNWSSAIKTISITAEGVRNIERDLARKACKLILTFWQLKISCPAFIDKRGWDTILFKYIGTYNSKPIAPFTCLVNSVSSLSRSWLNLKKLVFFCCTTGYDKVSTQQQESYVLLWIWWFVHKDATILYLVFLLDSKCDLRL